LGGVIALVVVYYSQCNIPCLTLPPYIFLLSTTRILIP
jgi:hypothetical protein